MDHEQLTRQLKGKGTEASASEVHGFITGWVAAGSQWDGVDAAFEQTFDCDLEGELKVTTSRLAKAALDGLADPDFGFQVQLPTDGVSLNQRRVALSDWCRGFLAGFGMTGRYQQSELSEEVRELFTDFAQISQVDDEIPDDDDNESDLTEITEYVRMGAVMVFTDCANKALH